MRKGIIFISIVGLCILFTCQTWAMEAMPVSPSVEEGDAIVDTLRPAFSWSAMEGGVGYEVMVFDSENGEVRAFEEMVALYKPLKREGWKPNRPKSKNASERIGQN